MTAASVGASLSQSDWIKARNFSTQQVGMIWGIPPQMLYADESGETAEHTYTQLRAYVDSCLSHYTALISGEIQRKLLAPGERLTFDFRHLLRGSLDQVVGAARQAIDAGVMTQNEAREMLNLPRIDGGDELVFSKNYSAGGLTDDEQAAEVEPDEED
jgi:HK97 family phage portal protein